MAGAGVGAGGGVGSSLTDTEVWVLFTGISPPTPHRLSQGKHLKHARWAEFVKQCILWSGDPGQKKIEVETD